MISTPHICQTVTDVIALRIKTLHFLYIRKVIVSESLCGNCVASEGTCWSPSVLSKPHLAHFRDFSLSLELTLKHSGTQLDDTIITVIDLTVFLVMCQYDSNYCAITFHGRCGNGTVWNDLTLLMHLMKKMTWVMMMTSALTDFTPHPRLTLTLLNLIFFLLFLHFCIKLLQKKPLDWNQLLCFCVSPSLPHGPHPPFSSCLHLVAGSRSQVGLLELC